MAHAFFPYPEDFLTIAIAIDQIVRALRGEYDGLRVNGWSDAGTYFATTAAREIWATRLMKQLWMRGWPPSGDEQQGASEKVSESLTIRAKGWHPQTLQDFLIATYILRMQRAPESTDKWLPSVDEVEEVMSAATRLKMAAEKAEEMEEMLIRAGIEEKLTSLRGHEKVYGTVSDKAKKLAAYQSRFAELHPKQCGKMEAYRRIGKEHGVGWEAVRKTLSKTK